MPNRVLREGALHSQALNSVSVGAECLFFRLVMVADDFGLFEADIYAIKSRCFALRAQATPEDIGAWLGELSEFELILLYENNGRKLGAINKWEQRRNAKYAKYPLPSWKLDHIIGGYVAPQARGEQIEHHKGNGRWWATRESILEKGAACGLSPYPGEEMQAYKDRIFAATKESH